MLADLWLLKPRVSRLLRRLLADSVLKVQQRRGHGKQLGVKNNRTKYRTMTQRDNNRTVNEIKAMMAEDGDFLRPASSVLWLRELSKIITHSITHRIAWRALTCRIFFPQQDSPTPREQGGLA